MKELIFLCIASCVFILSVIVLNCAPTINRLIGKGTYKNNGSPLTSGTSGWADEPCSQYSNRYNDLKDEDETNWKSKEDKEYHLDLLKEGKNVCLRKKAMIGLEHSAFTIDVIFGFVCALLGVLLYSGNNVGKIVGLIGLGSGAVGFVLTFIYIIYSGIVFNNDVVDKEYDFTTIPSTTDINPYSSSLPAIQSDGAFMEWKDDTYVCIFYDKNNKDKLYREYSHYGNKYLNYYHFNSKDKEEEYYKFHKCFSSSINWETCKKYDEKTDKKNRIQYTDGNGNVHDCDKLYYCNGDTDVRKNLYDSWVTTIVLGCFIFVLDIGLAIFGFLIFNGSKGSS
jgi:uncharacterized membrane protein (DUF485 family)